MLTVWKYRLEPDATINMPVGAQILSVHGQNDKAHLWALVNPDAPKEPRQFVTRGTGHEIKESADRLRFIGTFFPLSGLVFHIFEIVSS